MKKILILLILVLGCMKNLQSLNNKIKGFDEDLLEAIEKNDEEKIKDLIQKGANINSKDKNDKTALMIASENGNLEIVRYLVEKGANINDKTNSGWILPLIDSSWTALIYASKSGNLEIVRYLVEKGANVNDKDKYGKTSLMYASESGNLEIVRYLVEKGANVNDKSNKRWILLPREDGGWTALMYALKISNLEMVRYLVEKEADINYECIHGKTPLMYASASGNLGIVRYLIEKGANINDKDLDGKTPLMYALESGDLEVAKHLVENFCQIDKNFYSGNAIEEVVIDNIKSNRIENCLSIIVNYKDIFNFNYKDSQNNTLLHYAAISNNRNLFGAFLNNSDFYINSLNNNGESPLYCALSQANFRENFLWYLVNKGAVLKPISHINEKSLVDVLSPYEKLCDKIVCEPLLAKLSENLTLISNQKNKIIEVIKKIKLKDIDFIEERDLTSFISNSLKFYNNLRTVEDVSILKEDLNDVDLNINVFDAIFKNFTTDDYWDEVKANLEYNINTFMGRLEDIKNASPVPKPNSKSSSKDKALYMTFKAKKQLHKLLSYVTLTADRGKNNDKIIFAINQILAELVCRGGSLEAIDLAVNTFTGESSNELKYDISLLILNLRKQLLKEAARGKCTVRGYNNIIEQVDPENPHLLIKLCNSFTNELKLPIGVDEYEYNFIYNKNDILKDFKNLYTSEKLLEYMTGQIDHLNNAALWNKVKDYIERDIFKGRPILEVDNFIYDDEYKIKREALTALLLHFNLLK